MRDYVTLGPAPSDEDCVQVGDDLYEQKARAECRRYIKLLRDTFGPEPSGAYLTTKGFPHDFGTYYEVVCYFNHRVRPSVDYAFRLEREAPTNWSGEEATETNPSCPECGGDLELGTTLSTSSHLINSGFLCHSCRIIFSDDLTVLANFVG